MISKLQKEYGISESTIYAFGEFSILWCRFEQEFFNCEATLTLIKEWASAKEYNDSITKLMIDVSKETASYLGSTDINTVNRRIYSTRNRGYISDKEAISNFLSNPEEGNFEACFLLIYRIRNNFFHGLKSLAELNSQQKMIKCINQVLIYYVDR